MSGSKDEGICVSCAMPPSKHRPDCKEVARLAEAKKNGNGCGKCGGTGKVMKQKASRGSITFSSVKCPVCKGKKATKQDVDLTGLVELLAGERMDGTPLEGPG